ncbi:hypothetical protein AS589_06410 [Empedobacter brevis]|uniref:hypothetical protein n=1 Tax=Empedobacter brevis TaxID=247 RepID=UPI00131FABBE|nr:hypothetical protein [Empedobacter brevis]QHC84448.1 hypothetical protein AS589_06410 [Empedobacter brevis]
MEKTVQKSILSINGTGSILTLMNSNLNQKIKNMFFIPAEGYSFVINCEDFSVIYTDFKGLSTVQFLKNKFSEDKLQLFYSDGMVEIYLLGGLEKE